MEKIIRDLFGYNPNTAVYPEDRRMKVISDLGIEGMSSENFRLLLNETVKRLANLYVEVGTYKGSTLISAKYGNAARCVGVDNFSLFKDRNPEKELYDNLKKISPAPEFLNGDYKVVLSEFFKQNDLVVDVYLYDGGHTYQEQTEGLNFILPYLSKCGVIFVDDSAWPDPHKANIDWLKLHPEFKTILLSHYTPDDWVKGTEEQKKIWGNSGVGSDFITSSPYWWNGVRVFWRSL